jgi:GT2 family glycosyltransferase
LIDSVIADPRNGLAAAINVGIKPLPESVEFVNWLGDDDLLSPGALNTATRALDSKEDIAMVFGACDYIASHGKVFWKNFSGQWAVSLLRFGPDLIPQPGALFRRSAFNEVGGLDTKFAWAFDFALFIRLSKIGKLKYLNQTLDQFRWHPESLSVEQRKMYVAEASQVRVSHLPALLRAVSFIWEYPVRQGTLIAGKRVAAQAQAKARTK